MALQNQTTACQRSAALSELYVNILSVSVQDSVTRRTCTEVTLYRFRDVEGSNCKDIWHKNDIGCGRLVQQFLAGRGDGQRICVADVQSSAAGQKDRTVHAMQAWESVFSKPNRWLYK